MNSEFVYDWGPPEGSAERREWERRYGKGPARVPVFSIRELFERDDSGRYTLSLPAGVTPTNL
jgi:hypothetical protein